MGSRVRGQLLKGTTTLLVLTVLREGEMYGYEIAQQIRARSGGAFAPSEGSLYPALHALETDGALKASWRLSDRGPRRRYYEITASGLALLEAHSQEWTSFSTAMAKAVGGSRS
jgi:PadR family transcriptional regulator, regulatory protein PadR